jgi:hypothetical protein
MKCLFYPLSKEVLVSNESASASLLFGQPVVHKGLEGEKGR